MRQGFVAVAVAVALAWGTQAVRADDIQPAKKIVAPSERSGAKKSQSFPVFSPADLAGATGKQAGQQIGEEVGRQFGGSEGAELGRAIGGMVGEFLGRQVAEQGLLSRMRGKQ